jgi:hypothetical protein
VWEIGDNTTSEGTPEGVLSEAMGVLRCGWKSLKLFGRNTKVVPEEL